MVRSMRWILATLLALAAAAPGAAPRDGLDVRVSAPTPVLRGDVDVVVTVTLTNTTRQPIHLLAWQLPSEDIEAALFRITRDGEPVRYTGALVKRAAPQPADHVRIDAGATLSYAVELTAAYDLSRSGRYAIEYASRGAHGAGAAELKSPTLYLWLEGRSGKAAAAQPAPEPNAGTFTYSNCSASQQTQLDTAVASAATYATEASTYLGRRAHETPRYTTWFGAYAASGWATASEHFVKIKDAFDTKPLAFDCKCKKNYYAYVYPTQAYKIYLCNAFWSAPITGTDSRAGTLIHEMSHFDVVAATDDWAYGQTAAKALAISDPVKALANADSHEYFAENTPFQK